MLQSGLDFAIDVERILLVKYIYPHNKVVVFKARPGVIKLDPALMFKYLTADGAVQFIHIQVEIPTVLEDFCTGWGRGDGLTMFGVVIKDISTTLRLNLKVFKCALSGIISVYLVWSLAVIL